MGQLRTAIISLNQSLSKNPAKVDELADTVTKETERVIELGNTASEGWNAIHTYLVARFQKEGTTIDANKKKTMKDLLDSELSTMGKGIEQWRKDLIAAVGKVATLHDNGVKALRQTLDAAAAESKKLRAIADKKKKKLLASTKYKAKITTYLAALDEIDNTIDGQLKSLDKAKDILKSDAWVNKWFTIKADTTVEQVEAMTTMSHQNIMKDYLANQAEQDKYVRKWRDDYKSMGAQIATMKKWTDEADQMEAESTE